MWNFTRLSNEVTKDRETCLHWLEEEGLIPKTKYCREGHLMKLNPKLNVVGDFRCRKKHLFQKDEKVSRSKGTWLENIRIPAEKAIMLTMCFLMNLSYDEAIKQSSGNTSRTSTSRETVSNWYKYCRKIIADHVSRNYMSQKLGGLGCTVEVDECKLGRRKYNVGRKVQGVWIIGFIDRETNEVRLEICPKNKRNSAVLTALVKKHVAPGSTVVTDKWKGYNQLQNEGYTHLTVNHSTNFVDPVTGANTQKIESNWRNVRIFMKTTRKSNISIKLQRICLEEKCQIVLPGHI